MTQIRPSRALSTRAATIHASRNPAGALTAGPASSGAGRAALPLRQAPPRRPVRAAGPETVAFVDAAQAWFWTLGALAARRAGTGRGGAGTPRPCEPDDVIRALDLLHRRGGIDLSHARVLRRWGDRGIVPDARHADAQLWSEAMEQLDGILRAKQIVE